jgi:carbamoyl-phosphate synthase small subunit
LGCIVREDVTNPSNFRSGQHFVQWMKNNGRIGISGVDTRALTRRIREKGAPNGVIAHSAKGEFDVEALLRKALEWPGLEGMDLAKQVSCRQMHRWNEGGWDRKVGYRKYEEDESLPHVVAIDYGAKRNILRCLADQGARVTVVPATATAEDVLSHNPDGIFLSNGPGDPAATGKYAVPTIQKLMDTGKPVFGICLGHQLLGLALGGTTSKMHQGHHGANHPVKDLTTGKVEITSMNHGFAVDKASLPAGVSETHISLFDDSNAGLSVEGKPIFSVQYHPEASPGPRDSHYLFTRFLNHVREQKGVEKLPEHKPTAA